MHKYIVLTIFLIIVITNALSQKMRIGGNIQDTIEKSNFQNIRIVNDSYENLANIVEREKCRPIVGILFDLGISSLQLETSGRGFSFLKDEPLDMRFNPNATAYRAADIVNHATKEELETILKKYGEERFARVIAVHIVDTRKQTPIYSTKELVRIIGEAIPSRQAGKRKIHFATRTFQALRIAVNHEYDAIHHGIEAAIERLAPGGRIMVISFHSLEDRIVKNIFKTREKESIVSLITKKPIIPTREEIRINPRSRSAKLRIAEKI
jgi:16S rRNA (cytosine1402-N4)-methyltransferase